MSKAYEPVVGDVVTAIFMVKRKLRGEVRDVERSVFGEVLRVSPTRVFVQTLKTSFMGFSKGETWVPRESVRKETPTAHARWRKAIADCDDLVRAMRDAYVGG